MLPVRTESLPRALAGLQLLAGPVPAQEPVRADPGWSYRPVERPEPPAVEGDWVSNPIDAFVLARLQAVGLEPAPPADRVSLIRRVTYDLTGLPPTPEEVAAFVEDRDPDAYSRLLDRLLASPQYGVRWGRHWLDLVRFAETDSYERDRLKPFAWRYRDYVIDSFNADLPYDRFLSEQLAGDELPDRTVSSMVATGFHRLGIWDDEPTDTLQAQYDDLDNIADTTARVMLGVSMGCARCHDHKKDPIPQRDYYRFLAFFENLAPYKEGGGNSVTPANYLRTIPADGAMARYRDELETWGRRREERTREVLGILRDTWSRLDDARRSELSARRDSGLVAHYEFEQEEGTRLVDSLDRNHGEIHDVTMGVPGRIGRAFSFDGGDDGIVVPRPVKDDFTIAFWFRSEAMGSGNERDTRWFTGDGLVDAEVPGIVRDFGISYHSQGRIAAGMGKPERFLCSPPGHHDGEWHHVAFTRNRFTGFFALYVDGVEIGRAEGNRLELTDAPRLAIGRLQPGNNGFHGEIDDLRIYDRALDAADVAMLWLDQPCDASVRAVVRERLGEGEAERLGSALQELGRQGRPALATVQALCAREKGTDPEQSHVRVRGNAHARGEEVEPGFPVVLGGGGPDEVRPAHEESSGRRLALARWITDPGNPRTARVMVNRIWQHHFGRGLVRTPNDFGLLGEAPTHPELLDWLAAEFAAGGFRIKAMHRLIMSSSAYRMAYVPDTGQGELDPTNDLFWRFDMRRLSAEEIRDSVLAVNGTLNLEMGGPGVYPPMPKAILATSSRPDEAWGRSTPEQADRRTVYVHVKRSLLHPLLTAFDLADTDASCPVRFATVQPTQALTMLNGDFAQSEARAFAQRLRREAGSLDERIALGWRLVTGREPDGDRSREVRRLIASLERDEGLDEEQALADFCLVLLNLNEFLYLD